MDCYLMDKTIFKTVTRIMFFIFLIHILHQEKIMRNSFLHRLMEILPGSLISNTNSYSTFG